MPTRQVMNKILFYLKIIKIPVVVFALGLVFVGAVTHHFDEKNHSEAKIYFENQSEKIVSLLKSRIEMIEFELRSIRGLIAIDKNFTKEDFNKYAMSRNYEKEFPGALGFGFAEVKNNNRDNIVLDFMIPVENNLKLIGKNLTTDSNYKSAIDRSLKLNTPILGPAFTFEKEGEDLSAAMYALPIFKETISKGQTVDTRQLVGYAIAPIVFEKEFDKIFEEYFNKIDIEIIHDNGTLIYDADKLYNKILKQKRDEHRSKYKDVESTPYHLREFEVNSDLDVAGDRWHYHTSSLEDFNTLVPQTSPRLIFSIGLLFDIIISGLLAMFSIIRFRSEELANVMTLKYKEKKEEAELATKAKSDFLATIGHEIKTPLNGIIGLAQLLTESSLNKEQRLLANGLKESGLQMHRLLSEILDYSKIEAHRLSIENIEFKLPVLIEQIALLFHGEINQKNLKLTTSIDPQISPYLIGDEFRIKQILTNLISNAIKFTSVGFIELKAQLVNEVGNEQSIKFVVKDTGIGISKEQQEHLFSRFTQAEKSTARKFGGSGLGLSISKSLVELMHGSIEIRSELGAGCEFIVLIPLMKSTTNKTNINYSIPSEIKNNLSHLELTHTNLPVNNVANILIIDDNNINLLIAKKIFEKLNYHVVTADTGKDGVEKSLLYPYDIILLDYELPDLTAIEVIQSIREKETKKNVIVILSGHEESDKKDECLDNGCQDYYVKPLTKAKAIQILSRWGTIHQKMLLNSSGQ